MTKNMILSECGVCEANNYKYVEKYSALSIVINTKINGTLKSKLIRSIFSKIGRKIMLD